VDRSLADQVNRELHECVCFHRRHVASTIPFTVTIMRRVLLIAYQFPPVGGAGVQRAAKFTKYLPEHGWDVSVLTVSNPSVPLSDNSLLSDIPPQTVIRRAKTLEPDYRMKQSVSGSTGTGGKQRLLSRIKQSIRKVAMLLLQPDPNILWAPQAIRQGKQLLREIPHDAILVTGPPFSSFLVGASLSRKTKLPLILDYRDEWTISNRYWENKSRNPLADRFQRYLQKRVLRQASMVIATTQRSAEALSKETQAAGRGIPVRCLYNGFDADDGFVQPSRAPKPSDAKFRLSHVGTLWNLTTVRPLVEAIEQLSKSQPDLSAQLEVEMVGRCTEQELATLNRLQGLPCTFLRREYVDHTAAVEVMVNADELCLLLSDVPGAERVMPGKTFEYLATGRPVLAIAPPGEMRDVLHGFAGVAEFSPQDVDGIRAHLARRISARATGEHHSRDVSRFDRQQQAGELAEALDCVAASSETKQRVR
jgi:glycosyltransferase involved in cell wall biosynthesis